MEVLINIDEDEKIELYDDLQSIPIDFQNAFCRKGTYELFYCGSERAGKSTMIQFLFSRYENGKCEDQYPFYFMDYLWPWLDEAEIMYLYSIEKDSCSNETQSMYYYRPPKQAKIDKCKPRYGPKAQKYR
ncbi:unnamed protein product [Adineta ricciae]|nr:unnamed protein product [Adineta ricciae]